MTIHDPHQSIIQVIVEMMPRTPEGKVTGHIAEKYNQIYTVKGMSLAECRAKTFKLLNTIKENSDG